MAKNILLIDDEDLVLGSVAKLLKKEGYEVTLARGGHEAIGKVKTKTFDLIICDIRMPGMDGIEIIKNLREVLRKPIPEILITGYASEDSFNEAKRLKVADYIYKPFDTEEFLKAVKRNLKAQGLNSCPEAKK